ncbi:MAG: response regulator transcription factor [Blastocatellia bacterium]
MSSRILLVEDEPGLLMTLSHRLEREGYKICQARDIQSASTQALNEGFDLILLDLMLPDGSGLELCQGLRNSGIVTPVIMLTARRQVLDKVIGLKLGADDYVTKPFDISELLARIEAQLRRRGAASAKPTSEEFCFGQIKVNFARGEITKGDDQVVALLAQEYRLLVYLIRNRGTVLSRNTLLDEVWGYNEMVSTRTVDVHVAALRQKLEENPRKPKYIVTVHGFGYKFLA